MEAPAKKIVNLIGKKNKKIQTVLKIKSKPSLRLVFLASFLAGFSLLVNHCSTSHKSSAFKIVLIQYNDSPLSELSQEGIKEGLTKSGLKEGTDYSLKAYNAQGDISTLNLIFDAVINEKPGLVFVTSTPTLQVAVKKIRDIPVVFSVVADPVLAGAGTSFEEHLPNVTGISTMGDYSGMIALIKLILPEAKKIGTIFSPGEINSVRNMEELKKNAEFAGIELVSVPVTSSAEVADAAMSLTAKQPSIVCQIVDNLTSVSIASILKVCNDRNIPVFGFVSDQAEKGAVVVLSRDYKQAGIDAVRLAKKIMDGSEPSLMPFEFVSKTNILINQEATAKYGITIPREVLTKENVILLK
jgi:ABC-type uncharacterized transport system substrate-binding protein